ncbi:MAG: hypothetical protein IPK24_11640 [Kineosporiaceae bacterium]|nr:hypothetical protein [Kineosporiaceae bacterium]
MSPTPFPGAGGEPMMRELVRELLREVIREELATVIREELAEVRGSVGHEVVPGAAPSAGRIAASSAHHIERGAVTERAVNAAAADGARLVIGPRAVLTPLAKDRARVLGVVIERSSAPHSSSLSSQSSQSYRSSPSSQSSPQRRS